MKQYNPIYLCFCKAKRLDPDDKRQSSQFLWWVQRKRQEYARRHNVYGYDWTPRDTNQGFAERRVMLCRYRDM